jgi:hypothetical protein
MRTAREFYIASSGNNERSLRDLEDCQEGSGSIEDIELPGGKR